MIQLKYAVKKCVQMPRYLKSSTYCTQAFTARAPDLTLEDLRKNLTTLFGFGIDHGPGKTARSSLPTSQDELPERSMQDSFSTLVIPLASDCVLRNRCATSSGSVRAGRLMEYMDIIAVWTIVQYVSLPTLKPGEMHPYTFPTVLVDSVSFTGYTPKSDLDVRYHGHVSWAGRSSCEISLWLEQTTGTGISQRIAQAVFINVVRDFANFAPGFVNKLVPKDDKERKFLAEAEGRKERRAQLASSSLLRTTPDSEEHSLLHQLFLGSVRPKSPLLTSVLPSGNVWLSDTTHVSAVVSYPEDENIHGTVFGGFIMRRAVEVSETCAQLHSKHEPRLCHVSDVQFFKGVEVGALLSMHSQVVFTEHSYMQIQSHAEVLDAASGQSAVVALFHFTFQAPETVPGVLPRTYAEAMKYLDGRRHLKQVVTLERKL